MTSKNLIWPANDEDTLHARSAAHSCRNWSSRPDDASDSPSPKRASSVDLSLPALGKQQLPDKAAFPLLTKLLVSALLVLFVAQVPGGHISAPSCHACKLVLVISLQCAHTSPLVHLLT